MLVFANEQDLGAALSYEVTKTQRQATPTGQYAHRPIYGFNAVTGTRLQTGFNWLVKGIFSEYSSWLKDQR